jgi:hypothetical protein
LRLCAAQPANPTKEIEITRNLKTFNLVTAFLHCAASFSGEDLSYGAAVLRLRNGDQCFFPFL